MESDQFCTDLRNVFTIFDNFFWKIMSVSLAITTATEILTAYSSVAFVKQAIL